MIIVSEFFSGTLNTVDAVIANFVVTAYQNFVHAHTGIITLVFTVYIMTMGYQFIYHTHHFHLGQIVRQISVMLCVYGLIMNWYLYNIFVYRIFTSEPENIAKILIKSAGNFQFSGNISQALNMIFDQVVNSSMGLFSQVSFNSLEFIFYGALVFGIGLALCVFALLLFVYAKMMMAVGLALGPIFILFILWDATRGMFNAWVNKLITTALVPIVTSAILMLMLSVVAVTLPQLNVPPDSQKFYGIIPFLGLGLITILILSQVFRICGSLGGGIVLASISSAASIANSSLSKVGALLMNSMAKMMSIMKGKPRRDQLNKNEIRRSLKNFYNKANP